ncbi:unnamed protein product, partial [Phaeothamnion confervicola]
GRRRLVKERLCFVIKGGWFGVDSCRNARVVFPVSSPKQEQEWQKSYAASGSCQSGWMRHSVSCSLRLQKHRGCPRSLLRESSLSSNVSFLRVSLSFWMSFA